MQELQAESRVKNYPHYINVCATWDVLEALRGGGVEGAETGVTTPASGALAKERGEGKGGPGGRRGQGEGAEPARSSVPLRNAGRGALHAAAGGGRAGLPVSQPHPPGPLRALHPRFGGSQRGLRRCLPRPPDLRAHTGAPSLHSPNPPLFVGGGDSAMGFALGDKGRWVFWDPPQICFLLSCSPAFITRYDDIPSNRHACVSVQCQRQPGSNTRKYI